jgi:transcriptional regulator with XRE-family HTH domain
LIISQFVVFSGFFTHIPGSEGFSTRKFVKKNKPQLKGLPVDKILYKDGSKAQREKTRMRKSSQATKINMGDRVRQLREERGWSQSELASYLPGVHQQSIDQLERGRVRRPRFLPELAQALGTQVQWLLTGEGGKILPNRKKTGDIDAKLLQDVFIAVEHVLGQGGKNSDLKQKVKLICALYELMCQEESRTAEKLNQVASNIVSYEQFLQKSKKKKL